MATSPLPFGPRSGGWAVAAAIALLAASLYAGTIGFDYTLDDVHVVQRNPTIRNGWWWDAALGPYWPEQLQTGANNWRPLATLSWTAEWHLADGDETAAKSWHHAGNVLLYGFVTLAMFPVARRWCGSIGAAWVACALFAAHPAHTEVVAPIVGRTDLIASLGGIVMCECFWRFRDGGKVRWLLLATVAFAVGLGGKESAAPLIGILVLADWLAFRIPWRALSGRAGAAYLPLLVVAVIYTVARSDVLGANSFVHAHAWSLGLVDRFVVTARNTGLSLGLTIFPLRFHHLLTTIPVEAPLLYPLPAGLMRWIWIGLAVPLWTGWIPLARRAPRASLLWVAILLPWVPTSGIVPAAGGVSLRFLFLPTAFASCAAVISGRSLLRSYPRLCTATLGATGLWLVAATALTVHRAPQWRDNRTFYRAILAEAPRCLTANVGLGTTFAVEGDFDEARRWFMRAIEYAGEREQSYLARQNLARTFEYGPNGWRFSDDAPLERALAGYDDALRYRPDGLQALLSAAAVSNALARRSSSTPPETSARIRDALDRTLRAVNEHAGHPARYQWHHASAQWAEELGELALAREQYALAAEQRAERETWLVDHEGALAWSREKQRAIFELEAALALSPPPEEARVLSQSLEDLRTR